MGERLERGALTEAVFYIMLSLYTPLHGYGIMQRVRNLSKDRVELGAGTLYGAINTLLDKRWIRSVDGIQDSRKKEYEITDLGRSIMKDELLRLEELMENGKLVIGGIDK